MKKDDRLIYLISRAQHHLTTYLKKEFEAKGLNITPAQTAILFLLKKEAYTMTELSKTLSIDNSAITGAVDRLEKAGLAKRKKNPNDRRTFLIHITDFGKQQIDKAYVIAKRVNEEIKSGFSDQEINTFKAVLNSFFQKFKKR